MADLSATRTFTCFLLVEKTPDAWKKAQIVDTLVQYTFEVAKTKKIFYFPVKEKFITFPEDHWIPNKDELRGKAYCKYHNSWNQTTNDVVGVSEMSCRTRSKKGYSSSLTKKRLWQSMRILSH